MHTLLNWSLLATAAIGSMLLSGCAAGQRSEPCAPLWGAAIATSSLATGGAMIARGEQKEPAVRDAAQISTVVLAGATVMLVGEAARCRGVTANEVDP